MPAHTSIRRRLAAALLLAAVGLLAGITVRNALGWIGKPFPGFFLLPNGQVAPVRLPGSEGRALDQVPARATVVAVDGVRVRDPLQVYEHVRALPAGTMVEYELANEDLQTTVTTPTLPFGAHDAFLVFGVYLFNGIVFAAIGIGAWALGPSLATSWALLGVGLSVSAWALTALDFYGPYTFFRLHGLAETLLPGALLHLALVFPVRRTTLRRAVLISYVPALALTLVHQLCLADRELYSTVHGLAIAATAVAALDFLGAVLVGYLRSGSPLVRHRVRIALLGLFA